MKKLNYKTRLLGTTPFYQMKRDESGRSMVEMLGVLAVIGVLSVAGIAGYSVAMNRYKANELLNEVNKRANSIAMQLASGKTGDDVTLDEFGGAQVLGADLTLDEIQAGDKEFVITVSKMDKAVCKALLGMLDNQASGPYLIDGDNKEITNCDIANMGGDGVAFVYSKDLSFLSCNDWELREKDECICDDSKCDSYCESIGERLGYCEGPSDCHCECFTADTLITLANGTCKRADQITYEDELLVWNFDEGHFDQAKPIWLQVAKKAKSYNLLKFSDGSILKTINQHRIFNREAGKFTYPMTEDTPLGTHVLNAKGEWVTLDEKSEVHEEVTYYNIITEHHINCFAGNILTSCRLNNIYPIKDLKFVKDKRSIKSYEDFKVLPKRYYDGLRLGEQPLEINHVGDVVFDKNLIGYVKRLIESAQ